MNGAGKSRGVHIGLIALVISLMIFPLVYNKNAEFAGADERAGAMIKKQNPGYIPWFANVWEPPSGEVSSMLFALQAAIGSGVVCYVIGFYVGRSRRE